MCCRYLVQSSQKFIFYFVTDSEDETYCQRRSEANGASYDAQKDVEIVEADVLDSRESAHTIQRQ